VPEQPAESALARSDGPPEFGEAAPVDGIVGQDGGDVTQPRIGRRAAGDSASATSIFVTSGNLGFFLARYSRRARWTRWVWAPPCCSSRLRC
jgi:hypothetical protein